MCSGALGLRQQQGSGVHVSLPERSSARDRAAVLPSRRGYIYILSIGHRHDCVCSLAAELRRTL